MASDVTGEGAFAAPDAAIQRALGIVRGFGFLLPAVGGQGTPFLLLFDGLEVLDEIARGLGNHFPIQQYWKSGRMLQHYLRYQL